MFTTLTIEMYHYIFAAETMSLSNCESVLGSSQSPWLS